MAMPAKPMYAGIALTTGATLILELTLTRIFSVVMFYHFAFLAISLALFGLGASGIYLYVAPPSSANLTVRLLKTSLLAAVTTAIALVFVLNQNLGLGVDAGNVRKLALVYLITSVPFFFSGLTVSLCVQARRDDMGRLYFFDLAGAGLGCLLLVPLLDLLGGPSTVLLSAAMLALAGVVFSSSDPARSRGRLIGASAIAAGLFVAALMNVAWPFVTVPSVKDTDERRVVFSHWNSFSRVSVETTDEDFLWLKMDSSAATRIFSGDVAKKGFEPTRRFSETRVASLVYALESAGPALIIGPGGGADVIGALYNGKKRVIGVELNPIIVHEVMLDRFVEYSGRLYERPEVQIVVDEGRSFVRSSDEPLASIQATLVDTWAATSAGAFSLSENNLYTKEAFSEYLDHLGDEGTLTMTRWHLNPPKEFLRVLVLGRAALDDLGIHDHQGYFYVAADDRMATFLLRKRPFTEQEVRTLDEYVRRNQLRRLYSPFAPESNAVSSFLRTQDWKGFVDDYSFDISPPPDDRPFFFYTVRPDKVIDTLRDFGSLREHNLGLLLLAYCLLIVVVLLVLVFVGPLLFFRREVLREQRAAKVRYLLYFVALGGGFITVELALMQRFVLFLGHPTYALTVILATLLIASGIGSWLCRDVRPDEVGKRVFRMFGILAGLVLLYRFGLQPVFELLLPLPLTVRGFVTVLLIAPLGIVMGEFLPLGILAAREHFAELVPWAWGLNGAASVLGSVLTIALAMHVGFNLTLLLGLAFYAAGIVAIRGLTGK